MTRAQVVRKIFKARVPRKVEAVELSPLQALARTADLFDDLRSEMQKAELSKDDVQCGLVFCQPRTKGREAVISQTLALPKPDRIAEFASAIMELDRPVFLGLLFLQRDHEAAKAGNAEQANVLFAVPFTTAWDGLNRMLAARASQMVKGGGVKLLTD